MAAAATAAAAAGAAAAGGAAGGGAAASATAAGAAATGSAAGCDEDKCATVGGYTANRLNPFVARCDALNTTYDKLKVLVMSVLVFPVRVLLVALFIVVAWLLACLGLWGLTAEQRCRPFTGWRRLMRQLVLPATRCVFVAAGFPLVVQRGRRAPPAEAPVLVLAPHSSYFDVLPVIAMLAPSVVAKLEFARTPFFGKLIDYTQPVYVSREDPNSRHNTVREINRRVTSNGAWPQILLFPEGTCTNRSCLIQFKPGAFYPGVPVQPVLIRYPNRCDTVTWTWQGPGALKLMWLTLTQLVNYCEIEFLPVYRPSQLEQQDPRLFAANVRRVMADALGVPVSDYTYDDCRLMSRARRHQLPCQTGLIEATKLCHQLGITMAVVETQLDRFAVLASYGDDAAGDGGVSLSNSVVASLPSSPRPSPASAATGHVSIEQFAAYLCVPAGETSLQQLFQLYDTNQDGVVDFREFLLGVRLVSLPSATRQTLAQAFRCLDRSGTGHLSCADLCHALSHSLRVPSTDARRIFDAVVKKQQQHITFEEFCDHAELKPEYAKLFLLWRQRARESDKNK